MEEAKRVLEKIEGVVDKFNAADHPIGKVIVDYGSIRIYTAPNYYLDAKDKIYDLLKKFKSFQVEDEKEYKYYDHFMKRWFRIKADAEIEVEYYVKQYNWHGCRRICVMKEISFRDESVSQYLIIARRPFIGFLKKTNEDDYSGNVDWREVR